MNLCVCVRVKVTRASDGCVFVHQRSDEKRVFPSMFDMFVGGVRAAAAGETLRCMHACVWASPEITLLRCAWGSL